MTFTPLIALFAAGSFVFPRLSSHFRFPSFPKFPPLPIHFPHRPTPPPPPSHDTIDVDWGGPAGDPLFLVANFLPGDSESKTITLTNTGSASHPITLQGRLVSDTDHFADVLLITILSSSGPLYGPVTLSQFFAASATHPVAEFTLPPHSSAPYQVLVHFPPDSGNQYQSQQVVFDLTLYTGDSRHRVCLKTKHSKCPPSH